jgi:hypothetical protein
MFSFFKIAMCQTFAGGGKKTLKNKEKLIEENLDTSCTGTIFFRKCYHFYPNLGIGCLFQILFAN